LNRVEPATSSRSKTQAEQGSTASIAILNHIADSRLVLLNNCGHWPPFEKPAEWTAQVLAFLKGYWQHGSRIWAGRLAAAGKSGIQTLFSSVERRVQ
jgi:hypothetical protein